MTAPSHRRLALVLGALAGIGPFSIDMYLPALPALGASLNASPGAVQGTLAIYFLGLAFGQVLYGPLSDRHGRRPPLFVGLGLYTVAAVACALAPDVQMLTAARLLQALGGCAGMVIARAVVRDVTDERGAVRLMAQLMLVMGVAPIVAPMIGGALLPVFGWRGIFVLLAVLSVAAAVWIRLAVPDRPPGAVVPQRRSLMHEIGEFGRIFRDRGFLRVLPAVMVLSALNFTFQGLWAGPWLRDVAGLADGPRAAALLIYALGLVTGSLATGQAASLAQARGFSPMAVPYLGIGGVLLAQGALILGPQGFWPVVTVWFLFSFCGSVGVAGYAAMGQGFPPELQGRVATAINFAMLVLVFALQTGIGAILDLWPRQPSGGWDPAGYAVALSVTFLLQVLSAAWIVVAPRGKHA